MTDRFESPRWRTGTAETSVTREARASFSGPEALCVARCKLGTISPVICSGSKKNWTDVFGSQLHMGTKATRRDPSLRLVRISKHNSHFQCEKGKQLGRRSAGHVEQPQGFRLATTPPGKSCRPELKVPLLKA